MSMRDPVAVYNAANNVQAHLVRNALSEAGVQAFVMEDVSQVGYGMLGMLPEIHRPQVWVERDDLDKARPVLEAYERRAAELHDASGEEVPVGPEIEVACEECGERSTFPVSQRGSVQVCEHCGAFVDVDVPGNANEWEESPGEGEMPEGK